MKNYFTILILLLLITSCKTQSDIVDPEAQVKIVETTPDYYLKLPDELDENSGMIIYDSLIWTINDSGGKPIIYGVNAQGKISKRVKIENARNIDWEAITQDENHIYVGDFGNNRGKRKDLRIYKVKKADITDKAEQIITAEIINFVYRYQTQFKFANRSTPYDCEAMIAYGSYLYIFSKDWDKLTTKVYKVPQIAGDYRIESVEDYNVDALITGAHVSPDKKDLALIGYNNYKSLVWILKDVDDGVFFNNKKTLIKFVGFRNAQTEGICYKSKDILLISCENTPTFNQQIFSIALK